MPGSTKTAASTSTSAPGVQRGQLHELGGFVQDQWRARENLTINSGLRYELQFPFVSRNDSYATATVAGHLGRFGCRQPVQAGHADGPDSSVSEPDAEHQRVQDRLEQPRADTRPDLASDGAEGAVPLDSWQRR